MTIFASQRDHFKTLKDVEFLNESINHHMNTLKKHTDKIKIMKLLQFIGEYSVKTLGVSYMSNKKMAELIGVHIRTIQRYTATMERLGIISKIKTLRDKNKGQTSNTYIILPVIKRSCHGGCHPLKPSLKPSLKQDNINIESDQKLFKLFKWKLKDKEVQYGSSYVQKVIDSLFNYAENLINKEDRQIKMQEILESHGCTNTNFDYVPSLNWLEEKTNITYSPRYQNMEWLIK